MFIAADDYTSRTEIIKCMTEKTESLANLDRFHSSFVNRSPPSFLKNEGEGPNRSSCNATSTRDIPTIYNIVDILKKP